MRIVGAVLFTVGVVAVGLLVVLIVLRWAFVGGINSDVAAVFQVAAVPAMWLLFAGWVLRGATRPDPDKEDPF